MPRKDQSYHLIMFTIGRRIAKSICLTSGDLDVSIGEQNLPL